MSVSDSLWVSFQTNKSSK